MSTELSADDRQAMDLAVRAVATLRDLGADGGTAVFAVATSAAPAIRDRIRRAVAAGYHGNLPLTPAVAQAIAAGLEVALQ